MIHTSRSVQHDRVLTSKEWKRHKRGQQNVHAVEQALDKVQQEWATREQQKQVLATPQQQ